MVCFIKSYRKLTERGPIREKNESSWFICLAAGFGLFRHSRITFKFRHYLQLTNKMPDRHPGLQHGLPIRSLERLAVNRMPRMQGPRDSFEIVGLGFRHCPSGDYRDRITPSVLHIIRHKIQRRIRLGLRSISRLFQQSWNLLILHLTHHLLFPSNVLHRCFCGGLTVTMPNIQD
jgi:hypothetical protein